MKNTLFFLLLLLSLPVLAQKESKAARDQRMGWWRDATFGLFIHWGAYAVPAGEYQGKEVPNIGEWIMNTAKIPIPEYEQYVKAFNPVKFNAKEWVAVAKAAGIKYIVITSKHHDGFCLWDSKVSNYDVIDASPFKRDILRELTDACKEAGIRMCFYHSIMDWHHPDAKANKYEHQTTPPNWNRYRDTYLKPQIAELMQNYDPGVMWFDGEWIDEWTEPQGKDLYQFIMNQKPNMIINNRVGKGRKGMQGMNAYEDAAGDFGTPEQEILEGTSNYDWESCMTMNDTWGFKKNDTNWKSTTTLVLNLIDVAAKGGNYLLNIGPTAEGLIPAASVERLKGMGDWMKVNSEAIYATNSIKKYKQGENLWFTQSKDGKYIYALAGKLEGGKLNVQGVIPTKGSKVYLLGLKKPLKWTTATDGSIDIALPASVPGQHAWTFKIMGTPKA
jgi:alpha-L-fucosidase